MTPPANHLIHLLLALVVIIVLARLLGLAFRRIAQPPVVGEIMAGILLGPSVLGRFAPEASAFLLPTSIVPLLRTLADIGVIVYMFLVGIDFDLAHLRKRTHTAIAVSHTSIVAPFVMGTMLALWLYPHWAPASVAGSSFSLADISWMPYVQYIIQSGVGALITDRPNVAAWWQRVSARPSWKKIVG